MTRVSRKLHQVDVRIHQDQQGGLSALSHGPGMTAAVAAEVLKRQPDSGQSGPGMLADALAWLFEESRLHEVQCDERNEALLHARAALVLFAEAEAARLPTSIEGV